MKNNEYSSIVAPSKFVLTDSEIRKLMREIQKLFKEIKDQAVSTGKRTEALEKTSADYVKKRVSVARASAKIRKNGEKERNARVVLISKRYLLGKVLLSLARPSCTCPLEKRKFLEFVVQLKNVNTMQYFLTLMV